MRTYSLLFAVFVSTFASSLSAQGFIPRLPNRSSANAMAVHQTHDYEISYHQPYLALSIPTMLIPRERDKGFSYADRGDLRIVYPRVISSKVRDRQIISLASNALKRVDELSKHCSGRIKVCISKGIVPRYAPNNTQTVNGLALSHGKTVIVCLNDSFEAVLRHELFHARMTQLGITPKPWIEEGMAEYVQYDAKLDEYYLNLIRTEGIIPQEQILGSKLLAKNTLQLRASTWAITYYLVQEEKVPLLEVPHHFEKVDPLKVRNVLLAKQK